MNVSEIARHTHVSPDAVRYYVRTGLLQPRRDARNGYHVFSANDVKELRFVHAAKTLGYTLAEIREILSLVRAGRSPCARVRLLLENRIAENYAQIAALNALQIRMEKAREKWRSLHDDIDADEAICYLIECVANEDNEKMRLTCV